jgi:hypothetical protein
VDDATLLQELESLAAQLAVDVRHEPLAGPRGGLCRVGGRDLIFVDRNLSLTERVELMTGALSRLCLDEVFVRPVLRQMLEDRAAGSSTMRR